MSIWNFGQISYFKPSCHLGLFFSISLYFLLFTNTVGFLDLAFIRFSIVFLFFSFFHSVTSRLTLNSWRPVKKNTLVQISKTVTAVCAFSFLISCVFNLYPSLPIPYSLCITSHIFIHLSNHEKASHFLSLKISHASTCHQRKSEVKPEKIKK